MGDGRLARILAGLDVEPDAAPSLDGLARSTAAELGMAAVGFALTLAGQHRGTLGVSDERAAAIEDIQFTSGEGPCIDVHRSGRPVLEPDLATSARWPAFGREAASLGVAAVFSLPLQVGAARFGSLDLYAAAPGQLGHGAYEDALVVAEVATARVLGQAAAIPPGSLSDLMATIADSRAIVHQATGVVAVQLDVSLDSGLVALRARAFADGRRVQDVAADVVERRLRFDR